MCFDGVYVHYCRHAFFKFAKLEKKNQFWLFYAYNLVIVDFKPPYQTIGIMMV